MHQLPVGEDFVFQVYSKSKNLWNQVLIKMIIQKKNKKKPKIKVVAPNQQFEKQQPLSIKVSLK